MTVKGIQTSTKTKGSAPNLLSESHIILNKFSYKISYTSDRDLYMSDSADKT